MIKPKKLKYGDTIGILAPCLSCSPEQIQAPAETLRGLGFQVRLSEHLFSNTCGFAGSIEERAADFNAMIADDSVQMLLFGGGEVSNELLPYIDYALIREHPKLICSYSDSTTLLNAIHFMCGLLVFYGASVRTFGNLTDYNRQAFESILMDTGHTYRKSAPWKTICAGKCEGVLAGGYLANYAALYGLDYYRETPEDACLLFIEDHEMFSSPAIVAKWFANLEHRGVFRKAVGLLFGHYSESVPDAVDEILYRTGRKYGIPVVRCEDFGHGLNNAILPIGIPARLDTEQDTFELLESGVSE